MPLTPHAKIILALAAVFFFYLPTESQAQTVLKHPYLYFTGRDLPALVSKSKDTIVNSFGISTADMWKSIRQHADDFTTITAYVKVSQGTEIRSHGNTVTLNSIQAGRYQISSGDTIILPAVGGYLTRLPLGGKKILNLRLLNSAACVTSSSNQRMVFVRGKRMETIGPENRAGWYSDPHAGQSSTGDVSLESGDTISIGFPTGLSEDKNLPAGYEGEMLTFKNKVALMVCDPFFYFEEDAPKVSADPDSRAPWYPTFQYVLSSREPGYHFSNSVFPPWTRLTDYLLIQTKYIAVAYEVTGDARYANALKNVALSIAGWDYWRDKDYNPNAESNLDTANLLKIEAICYDVLYADLSESDRTYIVGAIVQKGIVPIENELSLKQISTSPDLVGRKVGAYVNSFGIQLASFGIGAAAIVSDDARARGWIGEAQATMNTLFRRISPASGGFYEGFSYGGATTDAITEMADIFLRLQILPADYFKTAPFYTSLVSFLYSTLSPVDHREVTFGDGPLGLYFAETMDILASRGISGGAWFLKWWYPNILKKWDDATFPFVRYNSDVYTRASNPPPVSSSVYPDVGYAFLRDSSDVNSPFLAFKSGPRQTLVGHDHYDQNAFALDYGGSWLVKAPGYQSFTNAYARKYTLGTFGQNSMVMDIDDSYLASSAYDIPGHDQTVVQGGYITDVWSDWLFSSATGEGGDAYNYDDYGRAESYVNEFERSVIFMKPDYFLIRDRVETPHPHRFSFLFHVDNDAKVDAQKDTALIKLGSVSLFMEGSLSPEEAAFSAHSYRDLTAYGNYVEYETVPFGAVSSTILLVPFQSSEAGHASMKFLDQTGNAFTVSSTAYSDFVLFRPQNSKGFYSTIVEGKKYYSDADLFVIRTAGQPTASRLIIENGSLVVLNSDTLFSASTKVGLSGDCLVSGGKRVLSFEISRPLLEASKPVSESGEIIFKLRNIFSAVKASYRSGNATVEGSGGYWFVKVSGVN